LIEKKNNKMQTAPWMNMDRTGEETLNFEGSCTVQERALNLIAPEFSAVQGQTFMQVSWNMTHPSMQNAVQNLLPASFQAVSDEYIVWFPGKEIINCYLLVKGKVQNLEQSFTFLTGGVVAPETGDITFTCSGDITLIMKMPSYTPSDALKCGPLVSGYLSVRIDNSVSNTTF